MMTIKSVALIAAASLALAACSREDSRTRYDGVPFQVKYKAVNKKVSRKDFVVEVRDPQLSETGARAAAHHNGVTYCLTDAGYGTSDILWENDPLDEEVALVIEGNSAIFRGKCNP